MKYTEYKQIRDAAEEELLAIDPDEYTDEELAQVQEWLAQASLELIPQEKLLGLDETDKMLLGLSSQDVIAESVECSVGDESVHCHVVKDYPEFSIVQRDRTNDFYRINHK